MEEKKPNTLAGELSSRQKYDSTPPAGVPGIPPSQNAKQPTPEEAAKEFEKLKAKLEDLKKKILSKYKFTRFLSVLPQQMLPLFAEDEDIPKQIEDTKPLLLMMCIPEDNFKEVQKIKPEIIKLVQESKQNAWVLIKTEVDLWNYGLDSKYDLMEGVSASFPLHDSGFLGSLRVANIHKSLVLRKFEKYVASYVIGGSLVRGVADKDSDVDTFIIIDDTDVKRMPRIELREKLRGMIHDYIREASALAGVRNVLNVQVYLLTDFWESVKDAQPVMFTFIRDGIPLYDRGTFTPWKLLLKMGRIKPSPEAIDMFMKSGEQTEDLLKRRLIDAMVDIYYGVVTPTQALMMLAGHAPPEPKAIVSQVKDVLVDKEKLMSTKELKTLEKLVKHFKDYEHGKLEKISGKEIDELKKEADEYTNKMKELRSNIELRMREHSADKITEEAFSLLKKIFGNKSQEALLEDLDKEFVQKGKITPRMLTIAKEISGLKRKSKGKKLTQVEMQKITAESSELITALTEYTQRKELIATEKSVIQINYNNDKKAEIVLTDAFTFLIESGGVIKKFTSNKFTDSDQNELEKAIKETKDKINHKLDSHFLEAIKKEFGDYILNI